MSDQQRCENCKYWDRYAPTHQRGFCRRYPPTVRSDYDGDAESDFPDTDRSIWCGEWKAKEGKES